jgi:uncharacterized protein (TIGR02452 family)
MSRDYLIAVINDTIDACDDCFYTNEKNKGVEIKYDDMMYPVKNTIKISSLIVPKILLDKPCKIKIINDDSLNVGLLLKDEGFNPVVLNMASMIRPGGGYMTGARAQEESLFRRTNLYKCLDDKLYPINIGQALYTPNAIVIKDSKHKYYDDYKKMSFIACPAYRLKSPSDFDDFIKNTTANKIRLMLDIGLKYGHDSIVLGAFGCGAYHNPVISIAELFKKIIYEEKYNYCYKKIVFAIIDDGNAKSNNSEGNFSPFSKVFD